MNKTASNNIFKNYNEYDDIEQHDSIQKDIIEEKDVRMKNVNKTSELPTSKFNNLKKIYMSDKYEEKQNITENQKIFIF